MLAQKRNGLHNIKLAILMFAAAILAVAPMTQLSAATTPNYRISIGATVDKHRVKPKEWFTITFKIKNTGKKNLQNVKMSWSPSRLTFPSGGEGSGNGATVAPGKYSLSLNNLPSSGQHSSKSYKVKAQFKDSVADGKGLDNMPTVSAGKVGAQGRVSDSVKTIGISVNREAGTSDSGSNANSQNIWLTARVLKYEQNPKTNNYLFNKDNPLKIAPGKWFQIQFKLKNTSGKQLKNVDMSWSPKNILFPKGNGKRGPNGGLVTSEKYSIKFTPFNKGGERVYTVMAKFKNSATEGETINAQNQGNMPKITANMNGKQVADTVRAINAMAVVPPETPNSPLHIAKSTDTPMPRLNAPFNYLITVKNTSDVSQKVTLNDINVASDSQSFTSVLVEGVTENTLSVVNGEEAVKAIESAVAKLASEIEGLPNQTEVDKALKALKQSQYAINKVRADIKKAKLAVNKAKTQAAKKKAQQQLKKAQQNLSGAKKVVEGARKAYQESLKATGEAPAPGSEDEDAAEEKEDGSDVQQILTGGFTLAAGATANIKLSAVIVNDSEAAGKILNSATGSVEGGKTVRSNETIVELCRATECGASSEVISKGSGIGGVSSGDGGGPAQIAATGPAAVAASVVGVGALGYGARQWISSRRAMQEAMKGLYTKPDNH